jgi:S1-C subfamily serine protease
VIAFVLAALAAAAVAEPAPPPADTKDLAGRIGPSVVNLTMVAGGEDVGNGTGFFVRADGVVVTNHHVIDHVPGTLVAVLRDGRRVPVVGVLADDEPHDLALVRVEGAGYPALPLAPTESVQPGERLTLVGSPFGFDQSVSTGIVSAVRADFPDEWKKRQRERGDLTTGPLVQHTVPMGPGASGSPLVDDLGRVAAVNHSGFEGTDINFAAHVDALRALIAHTDLAARPRPLGPNVRRNLIISAVVFGALAILFGWALVRRRPRRRAQH